MLSILYALTGCAEMVRAQTTERLSIGKKGATIFGNNHSSRPSFSADSRYVVFSSLANNLAPGDTNDRLDVFLKDRVTGSIELVSATREGKSGNSASVNPSISADGRLVVFESEASNLVPGDTNARTDVFVRDRVTGSIERVFVAYDGSQGNSRSFTPSLSGDGRYVAFASDGVTFLPTEPDNRHTQIFIKDRVTGNVELVSAASNGAIGVGESSAPTLSTDGRYVVFSSTAPNFVPDDTINSTDLFLKDRVTGRIEIVSATSDGTSGNGYSVGASLSPDGRYVAFESSATNLVPVDNEYKRRCFVKDRVTGNIELISTASDGTEANSDSYTPSLSADGRYVAFTSYGSNLMPGDTNNTRDVFLKDRVTGSLRRVSEASDGTQGNTESLLSPSLSADGKYVAFVSGATNLLPDDISIYEDVLLKDCSSGEITLVSGFPSGREGNNISRYPVVSLDGRYVAFASVASNLVPGDTNNASDAFIKDRVTGRIELISTASDGTPGNDWSDSPSLSVDGRYVAFDGLASNLVPGDTNGNWDAFVKDRVTGRIELVSTASDGTQGNGASGTCSISADGRYVAFVSYASNLVPVNNESWYRCFVKDRVTGNIELISAASDGTEADGVSFYPAISANGRYVAFMSAASNLVPDDTNYAFDIFMKDRVTGEIERVCVASDGTQANSSSDVPVLSADGRYVAFLSEASNLVPGDTNGQVDIFVKDRVTGGIERVSVASDGTQANYSSDSPSISADGRYVAFASYASNLVPGDTNNVNDGFIKDRVTGSIERVSLAQDGTLENPNHHSIALSADGRYVAFGSYSNNLVPGDTNNILDIFVRGPLHAASYVNVSGRLTLEDLVATAEPRYLSFTFRPTDGSGDVFQSLLVGPNGQFALTSIPAKSYELHIEGLQHLSVNVPVDASKGAVSGVGGVLRAGDSNDDDIVDVLDLAALIRSFDATPDSPRWHEGVADFNGDESVDVVDLHLFIKNFDAMGDA